MVIYIKVVFPFQLKQHEKKTRNFCGICAQVRNLRIGAMLRTVLPALSQAVVMHSSHEDHCEKTEERTRDEIQVLIF